MSKQPEQQAFPVITPDGLGDSLGMTMRQWYKGMALSALAGRSGQNYKEIMAADAAKIADAMLAEDKRNLMQPAG